MIRFFLALSGVALAAVSVLLAHTLMTQDPIYIGYLDHVMFGGAMFGAMIGAGVVLYACDDNQPEWRALERLRWINQRNK